jgi:hypothetical protein
VADFVVDNFLTRRGAKDDREDGDAREHGQFVVAPLSRR